MKFNFKNYIKEAFNQGTSINDYNIKSAALIGAVGHPLFAVLHLYLFKMQWDSVFLKICGGLVCILLLTRNNWPKKIQPLYSFYWHFMLIYNLSFLITLTALNNHFIKTWFLWEIIMIFILIMYVPHWLIFLFDLSVGILLAFVCHSFIFDNMIFEPLVESLDSQLDPLLYFSTFIFAIIAGLVFSYSNAKGVASEERAKIFKSLAGSIAHEIRNPLNAINLSKDQINNLTQNLGTHNFDTKSKILELTKSIEESITNANNIINIILGDLNEKESKSQDLAYLSASEILPIIITKYGYQSPEERLKVQFIKPQNADDNFIFKANLERLNYIIFNLLKNALYYLRQFPNSEVLVGTETKEISHKKYNIIYVYDTGPGIQPNVINKLFSDFFTSGKKEGTGLGLSFCKRNMKLFGGDIICESEYGKWTKFSLLFPALSDEERNFAKTESNKKKILIVDDQKANLITFKSKLEKFLPNLSCDIANSGLEAIEMTRKNSYQLILMDIEMPYMNGIETTCKIKSFNKEIPVIAFTSLDYEGFVKKIKSKNLTKNIFDDYLYKMSADHIIYRSTSKWINKLEDDFIYIGDKEDYTKILAGKKLILTDDQLINRRITKKSLESIGLIVSEANDGKELVELYKASLNDSGISSFDIILTDINMPPFNGDKATLEIREIEMINDISYHHKIPIIALTGDGSKEDIRHFFECEMTDYFIKGNKLEFLLKIIATHLKNKIPIADQ